MSYRKLLFYIGFPLLLSATAGLCTINPGTIVSLSLSPGKVRMELQIPLSKLELADGHGISNNSKQKLMQQSLQLKQYLLLHIHLATTNGKPWIIEVINMSVGKAVQAVSGP